MENMDLKTVHSFITDFWMLNKRFWEPKEDDQFWRDLLTQINELSKKYNSNYCNALLLVFWEFTDSENFPSAEQLVDTVYERIKKNV